MRDISTGGAEASEKTGDEKIIAEARARFTLAEEAEHDNRVLALEDIKFRAGEQWPEEVKNERGRDHRPCLVINKIPQFIQQITNDQRQNRPSIKVHPVDDNADVETAKVIQGLIRHIESNSNADVAYDTAFESAVIGGRGFLRVVTDYATPTSFEQEILIKRIRNPFSVFFDPHSTEPDGSDAKFALIVEDLSKDEFKAQFKNTELGKNDDWKAIGNSAPGWVKDNSCRVAEYFYKEMEEREICLLSNGKVVEKSELPEGQTLVDEAGQPITILQERVANVPVVKWCKIAGDEILQKTDWLGTWIPVIPVYGAELDIDGKRILEGVIRNAKDPARMYNYWASAETEAIALAPRAPFIAAEGQLEGYENEWNTANRRNHSVLTYKATDIKGQLIGPPQRNSFEPAVGAITQARGLAGEDLKSVTGIYDASLGAKSNETSGVAIQRRNVQAQTSNFHFIDNLTRSLKHVGRIIVEILPKIYDTPRAARIIGEDGEQKVVKVNQETSTELDKNGKPLLYKLDTGKYDVTVDVGPSYASKRQEAVNSMLEVTRAYPQLAQIAGDLLVKNMDWPGAQEFADRIKKTLPPGLADDNKEQQPLPPQVQQQMQQMDQMVQQLTEQLKAAQDSMAIKQHELESKERIEFAKLETQATIELAKLTSKEDLQLLQHQIAELDARQQQLMSAPEMEEPQQDFGVEGGEVMPPEFQDPTGGESPGLPMEQSNEPDQY